MELSKNTILITGGASGIGFSLARRLHKSGNHLILCGRRRDQLALAEKECPGIATYTCDLSQEKERVNLANRVVADHPNLNMLINNAGIQNRPAPLIQEQDWNSHEKELLINLHAPMHLSMLFISHLKKQKSAAIINVTSGLAFAPLAFMPTYCATKAAFHSFTLSLRHQLAGTSIRVIEVIPPAVQTDLGGKGLHDFGVPLETFTEHAMRRIAQGEEEFGYETSEKARQASRDELNQIFVRMNQRSS